MGSGDIFYRGKGPEKAKGELAGETFSFWPFSLSEPLNPTPLRYDIDQKSAKFLDMGTSVIRCAILNQYDWAMLESRRCLRDWTLKDVQPFHNTNLLGGLECPTDLRLSIAKTLISKAVYNFPTTKLPVKSMLSIGSDFLSRIGEIIILWKIHMLDLFQSGSESLSESESMHWKNIRSRSRFRPRYR